jgi:hypothetical protein
MTKGFLYDVGVVFMIPITFYTGCQLTAAVYSLKED